MTTIKDQPVYDISTAPHSTVKRWPWWHYVALGLGVAIVAPLTFIGAATVGHWWFAPEPTAAATTINLNQSAKRHETQPTPTPTPTPTYDLAGYKAAVSGSDEQAFVIALNRFRSNIKRLRFQTVTSDALALSGTANTYLADLRATNPPPGYGVAKLANMTAAVYARRAAATIQQAITSANLGALQTGLAQANKARAALAQAVAAMPKGS
jgi:hypothetical protein